MNTLYSEYKGGPAFVYCHEALHLQNKPQKAGTRPRPRIGTRTPTLTRPTTRTSSSKGSKRGIEGRPQKGGGARHGTFTPSLVRVYSLFWTK